MIEKHFSPKKVLIIFILLALLAVILICFLTHTFKDEIILNSLASFELSADQSDVLAMGYIKDGVLVSEKGHMPSGKNLYRDDGVKHLDQGYLVKRGGQVVYFVEESFPGRVIRLLGILVYLFVFFVIVATCVASYFYLYFRKALKSLEGFVADKELNETNELRLKGTSGIFKNITSLYNELAQTETELKRKTKLESLGVLLAKVLHDMNNVISSIKIYHHIAMTAEDKIRVDDCNKKIEVHLNHMSEMVDETFSYVKGDVDDFVRELRVSDLANAFELEFRDRATHYKVNLKISCQKEISNKILRVNSYKFMTGIRNIVNNGFEELSSIDRAEKKLEIRMLQILNDIVIEIEDNGRGLPLEILDNVFTPFITSGKLKGTGIGLSTAKEYIEGQGGHLNVTSLDKGTLFTVKFPLFHKERS